MTTYATGEIVLVDFPYSGGARAVLRPALVLLDAGDDDFMAARITTQVHSSSYEHPIADWRGTGLRAPSIIRLHKIATLRKTDVVKRIGKLTALDHQSVSAILKSMFASW
jgi:mRNA interferase MazF